MRFLIFSLLILVACDKKEDKVAEAPKAPPALPVQVAEVHKEEIQLSSRLLGRVAPTNIAEIRPQVTGIILKRFFKEGSFVKSGEQLYQIDPALYEAAVAAADGQLKQAKANLYATNTLMTRFRKLVKMNAISKQEYDNTVAQLKEREALVAVAQAELKRAQVNLNFTRMYAPIDGYVGRTLVTEGALVNANQVEPLAVIRTLDPVYIDVAFPAADAVQMRMRLGKYLNEGKEGEALNVSIKIEGVQEEYPHKGQIEARELAVNESSGSMNIRVTIPNPDMMLLPGMFVDTYIDQLGYNERLVVPQRAVQRDENGDAQVWVVTKNKSAERRRIVTGVMYNEDFVVEGGLEAGEKVAVDNLQRLTKDQKVSPLEMQAEEAEVEEPSNAL